MENSCLFNYFKLNVIDIEAPQIHRHEFCEKQLFMLSDSFQIKSTLEPKKAIYFLILFPMTNQNITEGKSKEILINQITN